ncbi:hypothetical protein AB8T88_26950, partial [Klebsiella pneumoniae]
VVLVGLAIDQIAQSGLSSLSVIYYSAQLFRMLDEDRAFIDSILAEMLNRSEVLACIRDYFRNGQ